MTNRTAPLKELLEAAKFKPECGHGIRRQGCKHCDSPELKARGNARRKLGRRGFMSSPQGRTAADVLIACSEALEKQGLLLDSFETVLAGNALSLVDEDAAQAFIEEIATLRRDALAKVDALNA